MKIVLKIFFGVVVASILFSLVRPLMNVGVVELLMLNNDALSERHQKRTRAMERAADMKRIYLHKQQQAQQALAAEPSQLTAEAAAKKRRLWLRYYRPMPECDQANRVWDAYIACFEDKQEQMEAFEALYAERYR